MESPTSSSVIAYGGVQDAVVDGIRRMILNGELKPGDRLRQNDLAATFGVSTMPIREALRQLQAEGLVTFYPRRGAQVAQVSLAEYEEIYRIREELEVLACRWVAENFEQLPMDRLQMLLREIEEAEEAFDDIYRRVQAVRTFFFTIFETSGKEHILRILTRLWDLSQQYRRYFSTVPEISDRRLENYRRVYRACGARDGEGLVAAIRAIYAFGQSTLIPLLREEEKRIG